MTDGLTPRTRSRQILAILLVLLGVGQLGLIAAAFAGVVDPGHATFEIVGTLGVSVSTSGLEGIFIGVLVLGGIVVLAFWEIAVGRRMLDRARSVAVPPVSIS